MDPGAGKVRWGWGAALALAGVLGCCSGAFALVCPPLPRGVERGLDAAARPVLAVPEGRIWGGVAPHHDRAGELLVRFYETLRRSGPSPRRILLLAPDHWRAGRGALTFCGASWETSRGLVPADVEAVTALHALGIVGRNDELFLREHGVTVHLPLLAAFFPGVPVLPLVVRSSVSDLELLALRKALVPLLEAGGLVLLSMDLSHGKSSAEALRQDRRTLSVLTELRSGALRGLDLDCPRGSALFLSLVKDLGARRGVVLEHTTSALLEGNGNAPSPGTSYATLLFL